MRPLIIPEQPVPVLSDDHFRALLAFFSRKDFCDRHDTAIKCTCYAAIYLYPQLLQLLMVPPGDIIRPEPWQ